MNKSHNRSGDYIEISIEMYLKHNKVESSISKTFLIFTKDATLSIDEEIIALQFICPPTWVNRNKYQLLISPMRTQNIVKCL